MKILFLTTRDDVFLPRFYDKVFSTIRDDVVGLAVVKDPHFHRFLKNSFFFMGIRLFLSEVIFHMKHKAANFIYSLLKSSNVISLDAICGKYEIPFFEVEYVNNDDFRKTLVDSNIDLIVSTSCPQIIGRKTLSVPVKGCINVHYGLLPDYRGMYPSFWVLANGEMETGVSVHYMVRKVDAGEILVQIREKVRDDDTFYSLVRRLKTTIGPEALLGAIEKIKSGNGSVLQNNPQEGSYFHFPQRSDMIRFLKRGRRWR
jgi:methionyl-tRNA formyltransferase